MSAEFPEKEAAAEKEYAPQELLRLVFWSFHVSQGSEDAQTQALTLLLMRNPGVVRAAERLKEELGEGKSAWPDNPHVAAFTRDIERYFTSARHTSQNSTDPAAAAARQAATQIGKLFECLKSAERYSADPRADVLWTFIQRVTLRETTLLDNRTEEKRAEIIKSQKRFGGSMFAWYALSAEREAHLRGSKEVPPLPEEWNNIWREAGDRVRNDYASLGTDVRVQLAQITRTYEAQTGEKIPLGQ